MKGARGRIALASVALTLVGVAALVALVDREPAWDGGAFEWPTLGLVERVRVDTGEHEYELANDGRHWWVVAPFDARVDEAAAGAIESALAGLRHDLTRDAATTGAALGFEDALRIEARPFGGAPFVMEVGRCVPRDGEGVGCWSRPAGGPTLYRVDRDLRRVFDGDPRGFRSLVVSEFDPARIEQVVVSRGEAELALVREGEGWSASAEGAPVPVDSSTWERQLEALTSLRARAIDDEVSEAGAGLAPPAAALRVLSDTFDLSLLLGGRTAEGWYAKVSVHDAIYLLADEDADALWVTPAGIGDRLLIDLSAQEIEAIEYIDGPTLRADPDPDAVQVWSMGEGECAPCERAGRRWSALRAERRASAPDDRSAAHARLGASPTRVRAVPREGDPFEVEIGEPVGRSEPGRSSDVWIAVNGAWARIADDVARTLRAPLGISPSGGTPDDAAPSAPSE